MNPSAQSTFQPDHSIGGGMVSSMKRGMKARRRRWDEDTRVRILCACNSRQDATPNTHGTADDIAVALALAIFVLLSGYWLIRINRRIPLARYMVGVWERLYTTVLGISTGATSAPERLVEL